ERSAGLPGRSISAIKFMPGDTATYYVALSGYGSSHVMKTTNKGVTWSNISSTLPDIPATALFIDPLHPSELYVATDIGVFYSPNDGGDWIPYGQGMPNVAISDMAYHKSKKVIRVATHGRSMWEAPLANTKSGISTPSLATKWFIGEKGQISWHGIALPVKVEVSINNGANWITVANAVNTTSYEIPAITAAAGFQNTDFALVRVSNTSETLISQNFRIISRSAGSTFDVVTEQPLYMYDIAYDSDENVLWVTNFNTTDTKIYKIDPDNGNMLGNLNLGSGKTSLTGIKYDKRSKTFYIHQRNDALDASFIYQVNKAGQTLHQWTSPAKYGTGIYPREDTLYLGDRDNNKIFRGVLTDPSNTFDDILLERQATFGPRCISFNPVSGELLHTWTDFQGTDLNAQLYDSYLLRLNAFNGQELSSFFVQEGGNAGTNVRGCEYDPRSNGESVWVTVLNSGNSSKILKITLKDGPAASVSASADKIEMSVYPNPTFGLTSINYFLERSTDVQLTLRDMLGRTVKVLPQGMVGEGKRYISFDMTGLASGTYIAELSLDGVVAGVIKIIKQ
ncbi:MAG TPA: T9SS type A sorting domain-containing protein, partial [Candidatus Kapabacteria bacterium]